MFNIKIGIGADTGKLILEINLAKEGSASRSGKSILIASTEGNADIPGHPGMKLGLNLYKPIGK